MKVAELPPGIYARTMTGRCRRGLDKTGLKVHALQFDGRYPSWARAMCGAKPGDRGNGWSQWKAPQVDCPECLKRLQVMRKPAA
jgi:hypothetical protein